MLIDCHVHLNNYDDTHSRSAEDIAADLFAAMEENGVDHAVVLTSYKVNAHRPHVDEVIRVVGDDPRISIIEGLRWRDPDERTDLYNMEERIREGLVKGIKLYPGYDRVRTDYGVVAANRVPRPRAFWGGVFSASVLLAH